MYRQVERKDAVHLKFRGLQTATGNENLIKYFKTFCSYICKTAKHFLNKTLNKFRGNYPDIDEQFLLNKST